jgi:Ricin-type beta-trefoil lectin domain.
MHRRWWQTAAVLAGAVAMVASTGVPAHAAHRIGSVVIKSDTNYQVIARSSTKCVDLDNGSPEDGTTILQWSCHSGLNQRWRLVRRFGGAIGIYQVVSVETGKCMAVRDASMDDGVDVVQEPCGLQPDRLWRISEVVDAYLMFVAVVSKKCLDVRDLGLSDGVRLQQWSCHQGDNQQFRIQE